MHFKIPVVLAVIISAILIWDMPQIIQQILYSISISIKSVIITILPILIFSLLFKTVLSIKNQASKIILSILFLVCLSNFLSSNISHLIGIQVYSYDLSILIPSDIKGLEPLWSLDLPKIISNDRAMILGLMVGFIASKLKNDIPKRIAKILNIYTQLILQAIVFIIPIFIAGFIVKLKHDGLVEVMLQNYLMIFVITATSIYLYISILFLIFNKFFLVKALRDILNMLPAAISGFSTMSSAASMPLTIVGAEGNAKSKEIAKFVIPATVNIHLIGDCFAIPIFAFAILKSFGMPEPSLMQYLIFSLYFVVAKFSVAAIPGGGIIVMLPVLQEHLGFSNDMLSLITALYMLFDPIITSANIMGNGAFSKGVDNLMNFKKIARFPNLKFSKQ